MTPLLAAVSDALVDHPCSILIVRAESDALRHVADSFAAAGWTVDILPVVDTLAGIRIAPPENE